MKEEFDVLFAEHQKLLGELHAMRNVKRPWVGLTDEHIERIHHRYGGDMMNCARAIERELREKNA
jgi:hypothetical protein